MARDPYYDDNYDAYDDYGSTGGSGKAMPIFLVVLSALLLLLAVLCVLLTVRLRAANKEIGTLETQIAQLEQAQSEQLWDYTQPEQSQQPEDETDPPLATPTAMPTSPTPSPTAEPTPSPSPTPTEKPVVTEKGGLPSWISEADMANIHKRPEDDEWYSTPGKLYVAADLGLRMRSGPTSNYTLITVIPFDTEVTVYAGHGDWRFVKDAKGNFGWVSNNLLATEPSKPVATATPEPAVSSEPEETPEPEAPDVG